MGFVCLRRFYWLKRRSIACNYRYLLPFFFSTKWYLFYTCIRMLLILNLLNFLIKLLFLLCFFILHKTFINFRRLRFWPNFYLVQCYPSKHRFVRMLPWSDFYRSLIFLHLFTKLLIVVTFQVFQIPLAMHLSFRILSWC
jgi:hypothetical protein